MAVDKNDKNSTVIVGLGASAGGIEACRSVLQEVPAGCRSAFIVVLHLDPTRPSRIAEILQSANPNLAVAQANGTQRLESGHVYVIAPNSKLHLADGTLIVEQLAENETRGSLVDYLFSSLAEAHGSDAVGVVLSGAGHDGTKGLKALHKSGGLCIAQDPDTASAGGMPQSAIDASVTDQVLPPTEIWPAIERFAETGARPERKVHEPVQDGDGEDESGEGFQRILNALNNVAQVNFDDYKIGTLARRTRRRMTLKQIDQWSRYADRLAQDRDELDALNQDVLIGVTEFFRDPDVWDELADELQGLLQERESPGIRAWVPGCATGEEAYTLAILAREQLPSNCNGKVQVYATDVNRRALTTARRGIYPAEALAQLAESRRKSHFNPSNGYLRIDRSIRDSVTFAPHNILSDPPFSKMDVVSCRNLLIYLKPPAHDRLLKRLHFSLSTGGLLVLGHAERLGRQSSLFDEISKQHGIFRARPTSRTERFQIAPRSQVPASLTDPAAVAPAAPARASSSDGQDRRIEQHLLRLHTTACAVVDSDYEIQNLYGPTERYLIPPTGEARQNLLAWIRSGFYIQLRSALRQAVGTGKPVDTEGQIERDGDMRRVQGRIEPLPAGVRSDRLFLVAFHDIGEVARRSSNLADSDEQVVRDLEQDIRDTRRELQTTVEQLEAAGEEHRASHEELLSLNEELQSTNEELEASKEELEALNEEMNTINRELEQKNTELRDVNSDLQNLLVSTGIPTVFLGKQLNIRRFTSAATEVMRLVDSDVGRSIEHVKERFPEGSTAERCRQVLETQRTDSSEIHTMDDRIFTRRITPYRTEEGGVDGVCITFVDVSEQKRAMQRSEAARKYAEAIVKTVRTPLLVLDTRLKILSMNDAFRTAFHANETSIGQQLPKKRNKNWRLPELDEILEPVIDDGREITDYEVAGPDYSIAVNARQVELGDEAACIVLSFEDISHHREREAHRHAQLRAVELKEDADRKDRWIAMLGHELRNPVGAVANGIKLFQSGSLPPERQPQVVDMMARQNSHVSRLLDELLDAARVITGKLEIDRQPVDLSDVGEWAVESTRNLMQASRHEVIVRLPSRGTVWVHGDGVRLTEVVGNLLTNAAKYTDAGGEIRLEITADDEVAVVRVRDTGIGISNEFSSSIFEIFTQGPRVLGHAARGLGLGLPLVKSLVEAHGGEVSVLSDGPGKGSEFIVTLPRLPARPNHDTAEAADDGIRISSPRRILIVDDVQDASESLALLLQGHGHETVTASDGPAALTAAENFKPDLALLDLGLPGMDGYELARRLREDWPHARLIAVTGYQEDAMRLDQSGFDHYLLKPIDTQQLFRYIAGSD